MDASNSTETLLQNEKGESASDKFGSRHSVTPGDRRWFQVHFGVIDNLVFDDSFSFSFINRYIRGIFPAERRIVLRNAHAVDVLKLSGHRGSDAAAIPDLVDESTLDDINSSLKRRAKQKKAQPGTHTPVPLHSKRSDFVIVKRVPTEATRAQMTARGEV